MRCGAACPPVARPGPALGLLPGLLVGLLNFACAAGAPVERQSAVSPERVAATLPYPVPTVHDRLAEGLAAALASHRRFPGLAVAAHGEPIFPEPVQQRLNATDNPALVRYAELPDDAKALDFFLYDPLDGYWFSEYRRDGAPVRFRCDFILHLAPAAGGGTEVEAIEYLPRIWPGDRFELFGRRGPRFYRDIRVVAPTAEDRSELLSAVRSAVTGAAPAG